MWNNWNTYIKDQSMHIATTCQTPICNTWAQLFYDDSLVSVMLSMLFCFWRFKHSSLLWHIGIEWRWHNTSKSKYREQRNHTSIVITDRHTIGFSSIQGERDSSVGWFDMLRSWVLILVGVWLGSHHKIR